MIASVEKIAGSVKYGTTPSQLKKLRRAGSKPAAVRVSASVSRSKSIGTKVSVFGSGIAAALSRWRFQAWVAG